MNGHAIIRKLCLWLALLAAIPASADTTSASAVKRYVGEDFNRNDIFRVRNIYLGDAGTHTMKLRAPSTLASDALVLTLPDNAGTSGYALTTDGAGTTNWTSVLTPSNTATVTNKTIDATSNTITNIADANVKTGAAIARAKLATGTTNHVVINDGSGVLSSEAQLAKSRGGTGADNSAVTFPSTGTIDTTTSTANLSNKTLVNPLIVDSLDLTKTISFDPTSLTGSRIYSLPDSNSQTLIGNSASATLTNKTIVAANNVITTAANGNLTSTSLNAALAELQTDIDTRATSSALTAHTGASTGVHGVTGAVVGTTDTQTLSNKTLTSPAITTPTGIVKGDVGLGNVDNTSDATKNAAAVTLTNKTITSPTVGTPTWSSYGDLTEIASPSAPTAGKLRLFGKTTDESLYIKTSAGAEVRVGPGGAQAVYTVSPTAVTAVGTAGMPQAGHVLDANDFTNGPTTSQYSFFNLSANANDGNTTNAKNLTANGTPTYTTTNVIGTANAAATLNGSTQYYSSTSSYYNPGNGVSWATGGWFKMTNWTPAASSHLIANDGTGASDSGYMIYVFTDGSLNFAMSNTAAGYDVNLAVLVPAFSASSWHHIAVVFDYPNQLFKAYVDGRMVQSKVATNQRTLTNNAFNVGGRRNGATFAGSAEDVFFVSGYAMTNDDIRKLYARRFDHNLAIGQESQLWLANYQNSAQSLALPLADDFVVSKDSNRLWADFSGTATGSYVAAKMLNTQSSLTSVPQGSYDSGYLSATPGTTIAHGLGDVPAAVVVYYETTTNRFTPLMGSNFCETDATNLYCDWTGLTVAAGSRVRIQAWSAGAMSAVTAASASQSGVVNTTAQTLAGDKTFTGAVKTTACAKIADYTVTDTDGCSTVLVTTSSTNRTVTLPSAATNTGRKIFVKKADSGTGTLSVSRAGSDTIEGDTAFILYGQYGSAELMSDGTRWYYTQQITDSGTWTPATAGSNNLTGTATYGTAKWTRAGQMIYATIESITGLAMTTNTAQTYLVITYSGIPALANPGNNVWSGTAWIRGTSSLKQAFAAASTNSGSQVQISINTTSLTSTEALTWASTLLVARAN